MGQRVDIESFQCGLGSFIILSTWRSSATCKQVTVLPLQSDRGGSHPGKQERTRLEELSVGLSLPHLHSSPSKLGLSDGDRGHPWGPGAPAHSPLVGDIGGKSCDRG